MGSKTYDNDINVIGKVTQSGTPSDSGDLVTKGHLDTQLAAKQAVTAALTDLISRWVAASGAGPASLDFHEDTDNGTNRIRVIGQGTLSGDFTVTIPGVTGTLYVTGGTDVSVADGGTGVSTLTGIVKGNGTSPFTAAVAGTDYYAPGGTDVSVADGGTGVSTLTGIVKGNGTAAFTAATAGTDYYAPGGTDVSVADGGTGVSTLTGIVKGNGTSAFTAAAAGTDYYAPGGTDVSVADGGTGRSSHTAYGIVVGGTTTTAAQQSMASGTAGQIVRSGGSAAVPTMVGFPVEIAVALSDETTDITSGGAKVTMRAPWAFTLTGVRASLSTASSSGTPTVDINMNGTSVLGAAKLTIDATEKTSTTAATATTIATSAITDDAELTFDIDFAGTGAKGLKVVLFGTRLI